MEAILMLLRTSWEQKLFEIENCLEFKFNATVYQRWSLPQKACVDFASNEWNSLQISAELMTPELAISFYVLFVNWQTL